GAAFPWRLFHLATGENFIVESLSTIWQSDFSRLMPSFIRPNFAAVVGNVFLVVAMVIAVILGTRASRPLVAINGGRDARAPRRLTAFPLLFAAILLAAFTYGRRPADRIEFE